MANITGTGYNTAYDKAMQQFNADQQRKMQEAQYGATQGMTSAQNTAQYGEAAQKAAEDSRRYSADFGLKSLQDLMRAGETERGIEAEGITADKRQFDEQQARPYTNLEFQRKMLEGLPIGASTTSVNQDAMSKLQTDVAGIASLVDKLSKLGIKPV
jgi:bisphosphoglycerate-dependent phosphoglycerate mutase